METISVKLPPALRQKLASEARRRNVSESAIVRESLQHMLFDQSEAQGEISCADLAGDLIGSLEGPADLSTNPRHLQEAIAKDYARGRKRTR